MPVNLLDRPTHVQDTFTLTTQDVPNLPMRAWYLNDTLICVHDEENDILYENMMWDSRSIFETTAFTHILRERQKFDGSRFTPAYANVHLGSDPAQPPFKMYHILTKYNRKNLWDFTHLYERLRQPNRIVFNYCLPLPELEELVANSDRGVVRQDYSEHNAFVELPEDMLEYKDRSRWGDFQFRNGGSYYMQRGVFPKHGTHLIPRDSFLRLHELENEEQLLGFIASNFQANLVNRTYEKKFKRMVAAIDMMDAFLLPRKWANMQERVKLRN